ncbi:MAG: GNAT family N-acetyltransferase, partial [Oscillospiraceae bacterium]|nr:GNAT family N-acetyltransferase [Oscillospiraceae bacterium]
MNKIEFRDMNVTDLKFLAVLLSTESITSSLHSKPISHDGLIDVYEKHWVNDEDEKHFIIYYNNQRVGWLKVNGLNGKNRAWISMLVIDTDYQNKGIGAVAVKFAEDYIENNGFILVGIQTTVDNIKALSLYQKCGYKIIRNNLFNAENR